MSEAPFRQYRIGKVFRAEVAGGPRIFCSNEEATELAAALPDSWHLVDASRAPKGLQALPIDGRLPGENGYRWP